MLDRRRLLALSLASATTPARALGAIGIDAATLGVRPGAPDDQSTVLQRAIDAAAERGAPLLLPPGRYRAGGLTLPAGASVCGVRGATVLQFTQGPALFAARGADRIGLSGLTLAGDGRPLPENRGLVHCAAGRGLRIENCDIAGAGGNAIVLEEIAGEVGGCTVSEAVRTAILSNDARGLTIRGNTIRQAGDNGIQVWRTRPGDDGTLVIDNRIEETRARSGGSGQYGNAINIFRAANVIVRGNRIARAAFSAVRGNAASNLSVIGNTCTALGEVALYAEFGFEGAVIANNIVDGAALGVSVTNFNHGGRLAVVQGNLIRNLAAQRPPGTDPDDLAGVGIGVEADTLVSNNVIENAPTAGIWLGWLQYLRDVNVTGNIVRDAGLGVAVSLTAGAGAAVISNNIITGARGGGIVGVERKTPVTGDLALKGAERYPQLTLSGNRVR